MLRYTALPQGLVTSPAAFNERMAQAEDAGTGKTAFPNATRLMDAPIEGEICALYWALAKFRYFIIGHPDLILAVDHQPLLGTLSETKDLSELLNHRLIEFSRKIGCFQPYKLVHIPGIKNFSADAGSRFPVGESENQME